MSAVRVWADPRRHLGASLELLARFLYQKLNSVGSILKVLSLHDAVEPFISIVSYSYIQVFGHS